MDPRLLYWTGALLNMGMIVAFAVTGVRHRRRGDVPRHRRNMLASVVLVALFLFSYLLKLIFLGREDLVAWGSAEVRLLRVHEACVATMLIAGALAGQRAALLARTRNATLDPADAQAPASVARWHRVAGWTSVAAAALGLVTAVLVLAGMYHRAGLL